MHNDINLGISIVIPLYNKAKSVENCIQSILNQCYQHYEVIIVDDGSTDDSMEKIQALTKDLPRFRIYTKRNGGVSSARNFGITRASFNYIAFLDADDIWNEEYLSNTAALIQSHGDINMFGVGYRFLYINEIISPDFFMPKDEIRIFNRESYFSHAINNYLFTSSSVIINKAVFSVVGMFDERLKIGEDLDMWFRIALNGNVLFQNKALVLYNKLPENLDKPKYLYKKFEIYLHKYFFQKYHIEYNSNYSFRVMANGMLLNDLRVMHFTKDNFPEIFDVIKKTRVTSFKHLVLKLYYYYHYYFFFLLK